MALLDCRNIMYRQPPPCMEDRCGAPSRIAPPPCMKMWTSYIFFKDMACTLYNLYCCHTTKVKY